MANQKIRNATKVKNSNSITFKSKFEKDTYNTLLKLGFNPLYEFKTFTIWDGFTPITPFYDKETEQQAYNRLHKEEDKIPFKEFKKINKTPLPKNLILKNSKIIGIRYTPDFYFKYGDLDVYIETKGIENDVFYIKKKMFVKYLDDLRINSGIKSIYFEVYSKKHLMQALEIIKNYG